MNDDKRQPLIDTAESETLRMRGNSLHGNRETLEIPLSQDRGRSEKALCHTSDTHVPRESEGPIVPQKQANKAGPQAAAESVEGRGPTKGNAQRTLLAPDAEPGKRGMGLWGVREAAKRDKKMRFTALLHHISPEMLQDSYFELKRSAAPGIDGVTWQQYGQDLEDRIDDLHSRVHRGVYWAQPSKRAWIPKADGRQRPLGIAALEDKIVQQAVKFVLESIYEGDFLGFTHICGKTRHGVFTIKRKSIAKRLRSKLQDITVQLKRRMHHEVSEVGKWLRSVIQGWFNYHAIPGNIYCLGAFRRGVQRLWRRTLRRRSQKGRKWTWERFNRLTEHWFPEVKILHPYPNQRLIVKPKVRAV